MNILTSGFEWSLSHFEREFMRIAPLSALGRNVKLNITSLMCRSHLCVVPFFDRLLTLILLPLANNDLHKTITGHAGKTRRFLIYSKNDQGKWVESDDLIYPKKCLCMNLED